jgi:hypothetical protein
MAWLQLLPAVQPAVIHPPLAAAVPPQPSLPLCPSPHDPSVPTLATPLRPHLPAQVLAARTPGMSGRDLRDICEQAERRWASKIIRKEVGGRDGRKGGRQRRLQLPAGPLGGLAQQEPRCRRRRCCRWAQSSWSRPHPSTWPRRRRGWRSTAAGTCTTASLAPRYEPGGQGFVPLEARGWGWGGGGCGGALRAAGAAAERAVARVSTAGSWQAGDAERGRDSTGSCMQLRLLQPAAPAAPAAAIGPSERARSVRGLVQWRWRAAAGPRRGSTAAGEQAMAPRLSLAPADRPR